MITIGRLAEYAGVTIKAVRHYHRLGLLAEPPRDSSGYRSYSTADALTLVKIRTLAEAGVPLARVKDLLAADPEQFSTAIAEIDQTLQARAEDIQRTRDRLAHLRAGDRLFLAPAVAGYLDRLRDLGVSQRTVQMERDGWILMQSVSPGQAAAWLGEKLTRSTTRNSQPSTVTTTPHSTGPRTIRDCTSWPSARHGGSPITTQHEGTDLERPWIRRWSASLRC